MKRFLWPTVAVLLFVLGCRKDPDPGEPSCTDCDLTHIAYDPQPYELEIPYDFPQMEIPADNPLTLAGVALGRRLFYDPRLSLDSTMSCATCHLQALSFTDGLAVSPGVTGALGSRSAMSLLNVGFVTTGLFWDGRVKTLEEQALLPIEDPVEMHSSWPQVIEKFQRDPQYPVWFREAFGIADKREITKELAAKAMAQFERTLISADSRFDRVFLKQEGFPTDSELRGFEMFFDFSLFLPDAECGHCHGSSQLTTHGFFNNAIDSVGSLYDFKDPGRGAVTGRYLDYGRFRAPTLRNIALTGPYMHDGRFQTLEEVIDHYDSGGHLAENYDANMRPLNLTPGQKKDLIDFLHTLTDTSFLHNPAFSNPWK
jgi:cytochrome c peroxidase